MLKIEFSVPEDMNSKIVHLKLQCPSFQTLKRFSIIFFTKKVVDVLSYQRSKF